jgi:hypothetical protein
MSAPPTRLTESFRACTRGDAANAVSSLRQRAALSSIEAAALEELLYMLCVESKSAVHVAIEA